MPEIKVKLFENEKEKLDWMLSNCANCKKGFVRDRKGKYTCPLQQEIWHKKEVDVDIARAVGFGDKNEYGLWRCRKMEVV